MEVFSRVGYQRATMSEVARRVGVSEPVIFQNFGSKAAVFAAVLEEATRRVSAGIQERAAANDSVGAWLTEFLRPEHRSRGQAEVAHHMLFADAMSVTSEPSVTSAIRRAHRSVAGTLAELLARGQAEGSLRRGFDPQAGAWWLLSFMASRGFRAAAMPDRRRLEAELGEMTLEALTSERALRRAHA
jgi:AcrR family transcriptional regulator